MSGDRMNTEGRKAARIRKVYVQGSSPNIRVPFREIHLTSSPDGRSSEAGDCLRLYDTSGPYTDP